jgi:nitrogen fixation NifU-like protein
MAYSQQVIDRFESVLNEPEKHAVGRFDPNDPNVATGMTGAPACGDVMRLQLKLNGDTIEDVKFKTYGCGSAIASSTLFVDMLKGKTVEEAKQIKDKDIAKALELPPIKLHCSVLAEESISKAIEDWENKIKHRTIKFKALAKQKGRLSMRGKGIRDQKQFEKNWDKIFGKKEA